MKMLIYFISCWTENAFSYNLDRFEKVKCTTPIVKLDGWLHIYAGKDFRMKLIFTFSPIEMKLLQSGHAKQKPTG